MTNFKKVFLAVIAGACFALPSQAADEATTKTLELQSVDVTVLKLSTIENEADENASEVHQESTVGRAGLQGGCRCFLIGGDLVCE